MLTLHLRGHSPRPRRVASYWTGRPLRHGGAEGPVTRKYPCGCCVTTRMLPGGIVDETVVYCKEHRPIDLLTRSKRHELHDHRVVVVQLPPRSEAWPSSS